MIESLALGTRGGMGLGSMQKSSPMGKTGLVLPALAGKKMIEAIPAAMQLDRQACQRLRLSRFSVQADEYEKVFRWCNLSD